MVRRSHYPEDTPTPERVPSLPPETIAKLDAGNEGWRESGENPEIPDAYREFAWTMFRDECRGGRAPYGFFNRMSNLLGVRQNTIRKWACVEKWRIRHMSGVTARTGPAEEKAMLGIVADAVKSGALSIMAPEIARNLTESLALRVEKSRSRVLEVVTGAMHASADAIDATAGEELRMQQTAAREGEEVDLHETLTAMDAVERLVDMQKKAAPQTGGGIVVSAQNALIQISGPDGAI